MTTTCDASEKFGPGDRFLLVTGGTLFAPPAEFEPFRFRRLFGGLCASTIAPTSGEENKKYQN